MKELVSVIISTYNSSTFIEETLESVKNQTWPNIELVVTDDCSDDKTLEICRNWSRIHAKRFTNLRILESERNTGVSANANRGFTQSSGKWIKFLGADDTLRDNCVENNMDWINTHSDIQVLFSRVSVYKNTFKESNCIRTIPGIPYNQDSILAEDRSAGSQYRLLLTSDRIHFTPSVFISRSAFESVGGFDERFRMLEDHPLWLNLTKNGIKLHFMEPVTVNYRMHSNAINNTGENWLVNPNYFRNELFRKIYVYPNLPIDIRLKMKFGWVVSQLFRNDNLNVNTQLNRILYRSLSVFLNPFHYYVFLRKRLCKRLGENEFYM